jgi:hypothetical protein
MRKVYFVPKNHNIDDYKHEWFGKFQEIHHGLSDNNQKYVINENEAHAFKIPEFQEIYTPQTCSDTDYLIYRLVDDFGIFETDPAFVLEVWEKDYENPKADSNKVESHNLNFNKRLEIYETEHIRLNVGWYNFRFTKNGELFKEAELSVFHSDQEEE